MKQMNRKRAFALLGAALFAASLCACSAKPIAEESWYDEESQFAEVDLSITDAPTEDPIKKLDPFLGEWSLAGNNGSFELVDRETVRYTDHAAEKSATCSYELSPSGQVLTLTQIDPEADGASLKSGGMICTLEDENHMKTTTLDGDGAKALTRVGAE